MNRRLLVALNSFGAAGVALTFAGPISALAQGYPERPLRFLVPYGPGGPTDTMARVVGQRLSEHWGKPVVIDNRPGATGNIGTALVARATADGHTILVHTSAFALSATSEVMTSATPTAPNSSPRVTHVSTNNLAVGSPAAA